MKNNALAAGSLFNPNNVYRYIYKIKQKNTNSKTEYEKMFGIASNHRGNLHVTITSGSP